MSLHSAHHPQPITIAITVAVAGATAIATATVAIGAIATQSSSALTARAPDAGVGSIGVGGGGGLRLNVHHDIEAVNHRLKHPADVWWKGVKPKNRDGQQGRAVMSARRKQHGRVWHRAEAERRLLD